VIEALRAAHDAACHDFDCKILVRWTDDEILAAATALNAGSHDGVRLRVPDRGIPIMVSALLAELVRRYVTPLLPTPPQGPAQVG
jgi:hypothetical protein